MFSNVKSLLNIDFHILVLSGFFNITHFLNHPGPTSNSGSSSTVLQIHQQTQRVQPKNKFTFK